MYTVDVECPTCFVHILNPTLAYVLDLLEEDDDDFVAAVVERIPVVSVNELTMAVIVRMSGLGTQNSECIIAL